LSDAIEMTTAVNNLVSLIDFCLDVHDLIKQHQFSTDFVDRHDSDDSSNDTEQQRLHHVLNESFSNNGYLKIAVRIGLHWGDVIAGIVGSKQPVCSLLMYVCVCVCVLIELLLLAI
jgi:hypothetical protein